MARRHEDSDLMFAHLSNPVFMIKKIDNTFYWTNLVDFKLEQAGLLPAFDVDEKDLAGGWKKCFESEDVILEIDNKSKFLIFICEVCSTISIFSKLILEVNTSY